MKYFWDIEAFTNLFSVALIDENDHLEMHYIVNNVEDEREIHRACVDSGYTFTMYDLQKDASRLMVHFEKRVPKTRETTLLSEFLGETDVEVTPKEHYYIGYNTLNYDVPMIDRVLSSVIANRTRLSTEALRKYSDALIFGDARRCNTQEYELYANQVDAAFLNEKMVDGGKPTIGLKTLVGVKGGSIIESESVKTGFSSDIYEDILYNINDVKELRDVVYPGVMETTFKIRLSLLNRFPSLRANNVTVNSSSAKFVEFIVSPDKPIEDLPVVDFMYPAKHVAEKLGVPQEDILEKAKHWYTMHVYDVVKKTNPKAAAIHMAKFMSVYNFYTSVRGKNWNDSSRHSLTHDISAEPKTARRALMGEFGTFLPFIDRNGVDSGTYANFSLGGIHGQEVFVKQLEEDRAKIRELKEKYQLVSKIPKKEVSKKLFNLIKAQSRTCYKGYPQRFSHEIPHFWKHTDEVDEIVDPEEFTPYMYSKKTGSENETLLERYKYTTASNAVHQDFAGYYPMLLINLGAFYDGNGTDNYADVYDFRISVKDKLKFIEFGTTEYDDVDTEQAGYKLILNSASGVLDGAFDTNLRANNKAMQMRIIGQIFTWWIGQALALVPNVRVPSSNTDGIYVTNIPLEENIRIVNHELKKMYIEIDPEPLFLVSKDANNRLEMVDGKVVSARGGTLTSWGGARVDNRLNHPALVDKILTMYLQEESITDKDVDKGKIKHHLENYLENVSEREFVLMSSWVLRASSASQSVFVGHKGSETTVYPNTIRGWMSETGTVLEQFGVRKLKPSKSFDAFAKQLFPTAPIGNPEVIEYLSELGIVDRFTKASTVGDYNEQRDVSHYILGKAKISNLVEGAKMHIDNRSLLEMSDEEIHTIFTTICLDHYVEMIASFAEVWTNTFVKECAA